MGSKQASARPRVAISSCLLGERVRYDGRDQRDLLITTHLSKLFEWHPVCPEVSIGLGVPRPPIQLVSSRNKVEAVGVDDPSINVTEALDQCATDTASALHEVSGYIFKSKSPSCGLNDTKLFDAQGLQAGVTTGLYAQSIQRLLPDLPVIDERQLLDAKRLEVFVRQVFVYKGSDAATSSDELVCRRAQKLLDAYCQRRNQSGSSAQATLECQIEGDALLMVKNLSGERTPLMKCKWIAGCWSLLVPAGSGQWQSYTHFPLAEKIEDVVKELEQAPLHVHW